MKYRRCLWCGDYFWAVGREVCCCDAHQQERNKEKTRKSAAKRKAREQKIRDELLKKLKKPEGGLA